MWSSKEVLFISVATGLVFCFATIYVQNAVTKYVNRRVQERSCENPLVGTGVAARLSDHPRKHQEIPWDEISQRAAVTSSNVPQQHVAPPGSGTRWTPLVTS